MASTTGTESADRLLGADAPRPVKVRVPARSAAGEMRAIKVVWQRELIRFSRDRLRIVTSLVQPFLFLFVLGTGLSHVAAAGTHGVNLKTFVFPGVLCIAVMFTAMFSAASLVWDREFGFLREMMVAPVKRSSLVLGKCFGGATVAGFQGLIVLCLAPLVGIPYGSWIPEVFAIQLALAFAITAFGVMVAARITQMQAFMALMQMVILPMYFLSGALYPVAGLPRWLEILNRIDPLTYAVDPIRRIIFAHLAISDEARHSLDPGVSWWGWHVPAGAEVAVIALLGTTMLSIAIWQFTRAE
jgi:ABC-2 type transport system permease protein